MLVKCLLLVGVKNILLSIFGSDRLFGPSLTCSYHKKKSSGDSPVVNKVVTTVLYRHGLGTCPPAGFDVRVPPLTFRTAEVNSGGRHNDRAELMQ